MCPRDDHRAARPLVAALGGTARVGRDPPEPIPVGRVLAGQQAHARVLVDVGQAPQRGRSRWLVIHEPADQACAGARDERERDRRAARFEVVAAPAAGGALTR